MSLVPTPPNASDTLAQVARVAQRLGNFRRNDMRNAFEQQLRDHGMPSDEVLQYWDCIDATLSMKDTWENAASNRDLAIALGIFLHNQTLPRNWLLYRLVELAMPDAFRTTLLGTEHMGGVKSRKNKWKPNDALTNRRIIQFDVCPHNGKPQNPIAVYELFVQAAKYI